ncbi:MAG: SUF system Fe-S cluster assembly regulator [Planctomycetes bacterium]|nr:SUF system Fe-S cluster assembly regulator [Planctomycetota bacterium]
MIRMTRLSDYAIMLLTHFARRPEELRNARDLAVQAHLPLPTVRKIMKLLAHHGMLDARRGVKGGFNLARQPEKLTLADIVAAVEGGVSITKCSAPEERCRLEGLCPVRGNWRRINRIVLDALRGITLAEMTRQLHFEGAGGGHGG